jgi:hypothetical protein
MQVLIQPINVYSIFRFLGESLVQDRGSSSTNADVTKRLAQNIPNMYVVLLEMHFTFNVYALYVGNVWVRNLRVP